jgi:hypothetical protein
MLKRPRVLRRVALGVGVLLAVISFLAGWALSDPRDARPLECRYKWRKVTCAVVTGRVLHVSVQDQDGDGDMHIVLASRGSETAPLVAVVKLPRWLRPRRRPGLMSWVSARGYLAPGAHGERELHASTVRFEGG